MKSKILDLIRRKGLRELIRENYLLGPLGVLFIISSFGVYTRPAEFHLLRIVGVCAIAAYFIAAFYRYVLHRGGDFQYVEIVGALILAINFLVQLTGGLHSFWFSLYMLLMIVVGINYSLKVSLLTVVRIGLLEGFNALATALRTDQRFETERFLLWLLLLVLVAIAGEASLSHLKRRLDSAEKELESEALREEEDARERKKFLPIFAESLSRREEKTMMEASGGEERGGNFETAFLEYVARAIRASHVCFFVRDESGVFRFGWAAGEEDDFDEDGSFVEGQGLLGYCAKNRSPLAGKRSLAGSARSWRVDYVYLKSGGDLINAYMVDPVLQGGQVVGVVVADRADRKGSRPEAVKDFTPEECELMKSAVRILEMEWLRSQTAQMRKQSNDVLTTFFRSISKMSATLDVDEVAALLVRESKSLLSYETAAVALLSEESASYRLACAEGFDYDHDALTPPNVKTWVRWAIGSAEDALLLSDFHRRKGQMPIYTPSESPFEVGSFLAIPLGAIPRRRGALVLTHSQAGQFSSEAHQLLRLLCQHASILVENAMTHRLMESLAITDGLTQLPNHRCFQDRLEEEVSRARRSKKPLSLLMVDIDHFKKLNDTFGHPFGDAVLSQMAAIIERCLRCEDFAARYGGEEFALILPDTPREGARQTAERLRTEVNRTVFTHEANSAHLSISGGIATYPRDAPSKEQLVENADRALYVAKRAGRDCITQFHVIDSMQLPIEFTS